MRQIVIASFTAAASHIGTRCHRADQAFDQALAFWGVQIKLGGGATESMVWAAQPVINPGDGIERLAFARLA
jgi:hypothetical protein